MPETKMRRMARLVGSDLIKEHIEILHGID
jgi:hypothetical protein